MLVAATGDMALLALGELAPPSPMEQNTQPQWQGQGELTLPLPGEGAPSKGPQ